VGVQAEWVFSVFTKPWRRLPLEVLAALLRGLGADGVELPVRPGFQVEPAAVAVALPRAARTFAAQGLRILSVAGPIDEATIAACGEAGVPLIRVCIDVPPDRHYLAHEAEVRRRLEELVPLLDRHGVAIGIQNHHGRFVASAMGIRQLVAAFDPRHVCAVWDPAHCALSGEEPELAADILWSHLRMTNLKNACWRRLNGPEAEVAAYGVHWTSGRQGLASWPRVAAVLRERGFRGPICLTAEYSAEPEVDRLLAEDLAYARSLFGR
jgi:sugar phosphate isomerase/epimerase